MFQTVTYPNNTTHTQNNQNNNMIIEEQQQEEPKKYKSIIELQKEINFYKNKERLYKMLLIEKQKKNKFIKRIKILL